MKTNFNIQKSVRNSRSIMALLIVLALMFGSLQVWGATTYKLTSVTSVSAGNKYVFVQSGYAMKGTVTSNYVETTNSYATTGLSGTESYVWTLEAGTEPSTSNSGFYIKNCSTTVYVRNSEESGTKLTLPTNTGSPAGTTTRMVWSFAFSGSTATISCVANSRVLAYAGASDYRYRAYASNTSNPKSITVYRLDEEASGYAVTYNNGGHGTTPSSTTASNVTLSAITGVTGYTCTGWKANVNVKNTSTSATISAGTLISNGTNVTLLGATTFTAQWEVTKYTVTFAVNVAGYGSVSQATVTNVPHGTTPTSSSNTVTVNGTTVTATPHAPDADYNYAFSSWSGIPASITGACTITANFTRTERALTNYRTTCADCAEPTTVTVNPVTGATATINWNGNSDDGYTVVWNTSSSFPDPLTASNSHDVDAGNSYQITGLSEGETYYVWVEAKCNSTRSDAISFTTPIERTITFNYPDGFTFGGTSPLVVGDGETFTFPTIAKPGSGYDCVTAFKGWVAGENYIDQTEFINAGTTSEAVTENATYTAVFVQNDGSSSAGANDYELVTDEADLVSGGKYIMVGYKSTSPQGYYALGKQNSNNRAGVAVTIVDGVIENPTVAATADAVAPFVLTLGGTEGSWTFYDDVNSKYLIASSGSNNYLRLNAGIDAKGKTEWSISIAKDGHATIDTKYYTYDEDGSEEWRGSIFYNVSSTLFGCYARESENPRVYLFKKGGTVKHILTAAPNCDLRLHGEVAVTAYSGRGIMAAEPLKVLATGLTASTGYVTLSSNSIDVYFSADRTPNFVKASKPTTTLKIMADGSGNIDTDVYVHYKPSSAGDGSASEVVVTATPTGGLTDIAQHVIHVRNMSEKFVIAAKLGTTWYALPADFSSSAVTPEAVVIDVDENTMTATASKTAPKNCTYTLWPVKTTATEYDRYATNTAHYDGNAYGECIRPVTSVGHKGLWATGAATGAGIKNAVTIESLGAGSAIESENEAYEWRIFTTITDGKWTYNLQSNQTNQIEKSRYLYLYKGSNVHWGTYNSGVSNELYFLPVTETEPFDMKVVEWYPTKILIQTTNSVSSPSVTIGGSPVADVTCTGKGDKLYEITIPGLANAANAAKTMKVSYEADDKTYAACVRVPVILSRSSVNVLSDPFTTLTPAVYNMADLVVRDGAVLTLNGTKAQNTFFDVTIYPTSKISVPAEKKIGVHSLAFFGGIDEIYNGSSYELNKYGVPELSLKGKCGQKTNPTIDYIMRVDLSQMYALALPYDVALGDITYWDGTAMTLGTDLYISAYDGQARANREEKAWVYEEDFESKFGSATLKAGVGYTISAEPQSGVGNTYSIIRLPMKSNFTKDHSEEAKTVPVTAFANTQGATITDNHKGWNFVGNPYMVTISGSSAGGASDTKLVVGKLVPNTNVDPWDGSYMWDGTSYRYVTIPSDDGTENEQMKWSEVELKPFKNFFIQVGTTGDLSFDLASRANAPARYAMVQGQEVEFEIQLSSTTHKDHTGLLIAEAYSPAYEINADLEKMENPMSVYTLIGGYKLAYNALSPNDIKQPIPVGYIANEAGTYTFQLDETSDVTEVGHIWLTDYEQDRVTDLMDGTYSFTTIAGRNETRFALTVELRTGEEITTDIGEIIPPEAKDAPMKFIWQDKMYILNQGVIYDATGKQVSVVNK